VAQSVTSQPATEADVAGLASQLTTLQDNEANITSALVGLNFSLQTLATQLAALSTSQSSMNGTLAFELADLTVATRDLTNQTVHAHDDLLAALSELRGDATNASANTTQAIASAMALEQQNGAKLDNATATLTAAGSSIQNAEGLLGTIDANVTLLDAHVTGDSAKIYCGVYVCDKKDPNYQKPAYVAGTQNAQVLSDEIVGLGNQSAQQTQFVASALGDMTKHLSDGFAAQNKQTTSVGDQVAANQHMTSVVKWWAILTFTILTGIVVFFVWPQFRNRLDARKYPNPGADLRQSRIEELGADETVEALTQLARTPRRTRDEEPDDDPRGDVRGDAVVGARALVRQRRGLDGGY
jgi:hypothetical protein